MKLVVFTARDALILCLLSDCFEFSLSRLLFFLSVTISLNFNWIKMFLHLWNQNLALYRAHSVFEDIPMMNSSKQVIMFHGNLTNKCNIRIIWKHQMISNNTEA